MIKKFSEEASINNFGSVQYDREQSYMSDKDKKRACDNLGVASTIELEEWRETMTNIVPAVEQAVEDATSAVSTADTASEMAISAAQSVLDKPLNTSIAPLFSTTTDYAIGDPVMYNGELYVFTANVSAGAWSSSNRTKTSILRQFVSARNYINNNAKAIAAFGGDGSLTGAPYNSVYNISGGTAVCPDVPTSEQFIVMTLAGNVTGQGCIQIAYQASNSNNIKTPNIFYRSKWSNTWMNNGAWSKFNLNLNADDYIQTKGRIGNEAEAIAAFGNDLTVNNAANNSMYALAYITGVSDLPERHSGTLLTYSGNTAAAASCIQIFISYTNNFYWRTKWGGNWSTWKSTDITQNFNSYNCASESSAKSIFGDTPSLNNAPKNSVVTVSYITGIDNLPSTSSSIVLETFGGTSSSCVQRATEYNTDMPKSYMRMQWGNNWTEWKNVTPNVIYGYIQNETAANKYLNNTASVDNAPANSVLALNWSAGLQGLPDTTSRHQGQLETVCGNIGGQSAKQVFTSNANEVYVRTKWSNAWNEWTRVNSDNSTATKLTEVIATFDKIGACGGSFATGYSVYLDSNDASHGVNMAANSWIQLWGRKHGITAKNFSSSGWSIKDWFASAANITAVEANPCKVYFTLFGGGNDIQDYDGMTNLGTISDVHVGSEDQNPQTFYGDYSRLIAKLQTVGGWHTKIISFGYGQVFNATKSEVQLAYLKAIQDVQALYSNVYFIPTMDDDLLSSIKTSPYYYGGHYSAIGYKKIADRLEEMVDKYVSDHPNDFADVQWIGRDDLDIATWY